jgi:hypothetical protein
MSRRTWLIFPLALIAFAILASLASIIGSAVASVVMPQRPPEDLVSINPMESYTLSETVEGDLFITGTTIELTSDSHVLGDVSLVGEDITIAGRIDGDLTIIAGGTINLASSAEIQGDALLFGDNVLLANASVAGDLDATGNRVELVEGTVSSGSLNLCTTDCQLPVMPPQATPINTLFLGLTLAGASGLAVVVFPRSIGRMEDAVRHDARKVAVLGFGVLLLAGGVTVVWLLLLATIPPLGVLLIPVFGIAMIALLVLAVSGWITISLMVGDILLRGVLKVTLPALVEAVAGMALLIGLVIGVSLIPFGAIAMLPIVIALTSVGLGAAVSTRLGRRPQRGARLVQG